jgi:hypothetical protein
VSADEPKPPPESTPVEAEAPEVAAEQTAEEPTAPAGPEPVVTPRTAEASASPEPAVPDVEVAEAAPSEKTDDAEADAGEETKWYDDVSLGVFADAYGSINYNFPVPQGGTNRLRAFDQDNGFSIAWAGLDVAYERPKFGATVNLRFGTGPNAGWADDAIPGIQHVKQAYVTWKPWKRLAIDLGRFDTIYGAEVSESWMNHTYTRGFLYNLAQPFWHTGLRVGIEAHEQVHFNILAVNGWGHIVDNNAGKTFGGQIALSSKNGVVGLAVGYLGGPESDEVDSETGERVPNANRRARHLADAVMTIDYKRLSVALNADYIYDDTPSFYGPDQEWYGGMASASIRVVDWFYLAGRGEFLGDPDGFMSGSRNTFLGTGTLTLDFRPVDHLTLRIDGRYDGASRSIFADGFEGSTQHQFTTTVGMVVSNF